MGSGGFGEGRSDTGEHVHDPQIRVRPIGELQWGILFEGMVVRKCGSSRHLDVDDLRGPTGRTTVRTFGESSSRASCSSATVRCSIGREDHAALCPRCESSFRTSSMGRRSWGLEVHTTVDPLAGSSFRASIGPTARPLFPPEVGFDALASGEATDTSKRDTPPEVGEVTPPTLTHVTGK